MAKFRKSQQGNAIAFVGIAVLIIISILVYITNMSRELQDSIDRTLDELLDQQQFGVSEYISDKMNILNGVADGAKVMFGEQEFDIENSQELIVFLQSVEHRSDFSHIIVAQANGRGVQTNGSSVDVSDSDFFMQALEGEEVVSELMPLSNEGASGDCAVVISMPIIGENSEVLGVVSAQIASTTLESILLPSYNGAGITALLDTQGDVIATTENQDGVVTGINVFSLMGALEFSETVSVSSLVEILESEERHGYMSYTINGVDKRFKYVPIHQTGWTLLVSVPEDLVSQDTNAVIFYTALLFTEILLIMIIIYLRLISIRKEAIKEIENTAYYDELTGLMNEKKFKLDMADILREHKDEQFSIIKLDVVNFKIINKIFDYDLGNKIIMTMSELSQVIESMMKDDYFLCARANADEFLVFGRYEKLHAIGLGKDIYENIINEKVNKMCARTLKFRYSRFKVPLGETNADYIMDMVALTHNYAKETEFAGIYDYNENAKEQLLHRTRISDQMREALYSNEFKVYIQPKNRLSDNTICGGEALVRWHKPSGEILYPNEFIAIFEQDGFITELDSYMLQNVCGIVKRFRDSGLGDIPISVNFSRMHMLDEKFVYQLTHIVDSFDIPRRLIELEMTETSMVENEEDFKKLFQELHEQGFTLSMDDFGAGYSSMELLAELSFDILKLDRSLLENMEGSEKKRLVVETILQMAKSLSLKTVCEGVETKEQLEFLKDAGCEVAQGFYYSKPVPNESFEEMLKSSI